MPGQRPFLRVVDAPSHTWDFGDHFRMKLETNMQDPNATVDITTSAQPIAGCVHKGCRKLRLGFFHGYLKHQETHGRRGAKRKQSFNFDCFLSGARHGCGVWRIVCRLSLPTKDADGNITGRRYVAKTTHTIIHQNTPNPVPESKFTGARAFTITESLTKSGQRPWLRVLEAPSVVTRGHEGVALNLETNITDPEVKIDYRCRPLDGRDYDDLDNFPNQKRLDRSNEFVLHGFIQNQGTRGQKRKLVQQYKLGAIYDMFDLHDLRCSKHRVIFTLYKKGTPWMDDRENLAVATHIITRAPGKWAPEVVLKQPHGKGRRF
ncbi:hypothetical protein CC79DRAFT_1363440 [Sarocladium strictum]